MIFRRSRNRFSIAQADLIPLREQQKQTTVPEVKNSVLLMQRHGKEIELAGHLLPGAMELTQQIYADYRISTFSHFYDKIRPIYLK
jgi:hypothetical protein